jgi:hypothetical protein
VWGNYSPSLNPPTLIVNLHFFLNWLSNKLLFMAHAISDVTFCMTHAITYAFSVFFMTLAKESGVAVMKCLNNYTCRHVFRNS